jgi:DNA polymerase-3 subunit beta
LLAFSIDREAFLQGLHRVQNIVEKKNTVPILGNVLFEGKGGKLRMAATDMEVGVSGYLDALMSSEGATTVSARKLFEIVKELPAEGKVSFSLKPEERSEIRCGSSSFELMGLPAADFPPFPSFKEEKFFSLRSDTLRDMIRKTLYASSTDETRYNFTGVLLETVEAKKKGNVRMVATDGHRLAFCEREVEGKARGGESVIIPRKSLQELRRLLDEGDGDIQLDFQKPHGIFKKNSLVLVTRLLEMTFPNYQQVIPKEEGLVAHMSREPFMGAIRRVSLLSSERSRAVKFSFRPGELTVHTANPDLGKASESLAAEFAGEEVEISFNARYLLDSLSALDSDEVTLILRDPLSSCLITPRGDKSTLAVIMPMRV